MIGWVVNLVQYSVGLMGSSMVNSLGRYPNAIKHEMSAEF